MKGKNNKGFNLVTVILIIIIVSVVSGITTGVIVTNTYKGIYAAGDNALTEFLNVYSDITNNYYEDINKEEMIDKAVDAMLEYLGDSYTTYLDSEERDALEERLNGTYKGIGVSFLNKRIVSVIRDTPAYSAGLMAGDEFIKICDQDTTNMTDSEISSLIKNSKEEKIAITVLRNEQEMTFSIDIDTLDNYVISSSMLENSTVGYVSVPIFSKNVSVQAKNAILDLEEKGMDRLILDLRDDTGGYLDEANNLASVFLEKGKVIYSLEDKSGKVYYYDETNDKKNYPIVVLLNNNSASASEILAAALKDSYGAIIVGVTSYGKGKVQQTVNMSDGSMAKYTSAKWFRPNDTCIDGKGIIPDYTVEIEYTYDEEGNKTSIIDTQLNKAIEIIGTM